MSDRTKELILKALISIGMLLLFMLCPGGFIWPWFVANEEIAMFLIYSNIFAFFGVGILFIILLHVFGGIKSKPVKAEKRPLVFASYNELSLFLQKRLLQRKFQMEKSLIIANGELTLYFKKTKLWTLECFSIVRVPELTDELLDNANEIITNMLNKYYGHKTITDTVNMISIFCVDRITPTFQKLVNSNVQQGLKNGRLPVGISFGGKNIYLPKQKEGFAIAKYKRLRKKFIDIMEEK